MGVGGGHGKKFMRIIMLMGTISFTMSLSSVQFDLLSFSANSSFDIK